MEAKDRYKINIIPCNTGKVAKEVLPKSRSVDDMDIIVKSAGIDPGSPQKPPADKDKKKDLAMKHLGMIAKRAKDVQRKQKKMKSRTC